MAVHPQRSRHKRNESDRQVRPAYTANIPLYLPIWIFSRPADSRKAFDNGFMQFFSQRNSLTEEALFVPSARSSVSQFILNLSLGLSGKYGATPCRSLDIKFGNSPMTYVLDRHSILLSSYTSNYRKFHSMVSDSCNILITLYT